MYKGKSILGVIPARGCNDGIEHMNMRELGGRHLIYYTFRAALQNEYIDQLIVSTEDKTIAEYAREQGVEVPFLRDPTLSNIAVDMTDILKEATDFYSEKGKNFDYVLALYPNAPFKTSKLITEFMEKIVSGDFDMVIPVYAHQDFFWKEKSGYLSLLFDKERHSRRNAVKKYEERGGIYIFKSGSLSQKDFKKIKIGFCELKYHQSRMINCLYDLYTLERVVKLPEKLLQDMLDFK